MYRSGVEIMQATMNGEVLARFCAADPTRAQVLLALRETLADLADLLGSPGRACPIT